MTDGCDQSCLPEVLTWTSHSSGVCLMCEKRLCSGCAMFPMIIAWLSYDPGGVVNVG